MRLKNFFSLKTIKGFTFPTIVLTVLLSFLSSHLYDTYVRNEKDEIKFKDVDGREIIGWFDKKISSVVKDATDIYKKEEYDEVIRRIEGLYNTDLTNGISEREEAILNIIKGCAFQQKGELEKAEESFLKAYSCYKTAYLCEIISRLYEKMNKETGDEIFLRKTIEFLKESKEISMVYKSLKTHILDMGIFEQYLADIPNKSPRDRLFMNDSGEIYIVSVGINNYYDELIAPLDFAISDAKDFNNVTKALYGKRVKSFNITGEEATKNGIMKAVNEIGKNIKEKDKLIFYFSGHGLVNLAKEELTWTEYIDIKSSQFNISGLLSSDDRYLLPVDFDYKNPVNTAISAYEIKEIFKTFNLEQPPLLILDACANEASSTSGNSNLHKNKLLYDGLRVSYKNREINRLIKDLTERNENNNFNKPIVINSTSLGERSAESTKLKNSVFSYFLIKGLSNSKELDINKDEVLTLGELLDYVQLKTSSYAHTHGYKQNISVEY